MQPERDVVAVVYAAGAADAYGPTLSSLRRAHPGLTIVVGCEDPREAAPLVALGAEPVAAGSASALVNQVWREHGGHVLAVTDTAVFPPRAIEPALEMVGEDMRVATVSFLCNAAGFLSFPYRNHQASHQVESLDEEAITRLLRSTTPHQAPAPIPFAAGPAVLLSASGLSAIGELVEVGGLRAAVAIADYSLRGRRRGFLDLVDPSTFCARPYDLAPVTDSWLDVEERQWLQTNHPLFAEIIAQEFHSQASPLATVHGASRAKVLGLRVLIDGSCLGPKETGTQVQTTALISALARRPDVQRVSVALTGDAPTYAQAVLAAPKVDARFVPDGDVSDFGPVEVAHRPFQPIGPLHPTWSKLAARTAVTIQDLIAYHGAAYFSSPAEWVADRDAVRLVTGKVDGLVAISHDVLARLALERLPIETERMFVVENGTDHLRGDEAASCPAELVSRGFVAGQFALVLGTNYAHKNRDLAIEVVAELRRRGFRVALVIAGAAVPFGSSRILESRARRDDDAVFIIPDVTSEERNWLLRHASIVLYPTSAEGFGLIPYEAARFGTPTVLVPFGPLGEVIGDLPVLAADWSRTALADAAERLLADPATARDQVAAALGAGRGYTWDATAAKLVDVYRLLLARPARGGEARA